MEGDDHDKLDTAREGQDGLQQVADGVAVVGGKPDDHEGDHGGQEDSDQLRGDDVHCDLGIEGGDHDKLETDREGRDGLQQATGLVVVGGKQGDHEGDRGGREDSDQLHGDDDDKLHGFDNKKNRIYDRQD